MSEPDVPRLSGDRLPAGPNTGRPAGTQFRVIDPDVDLRDPTQQPGGLRQWALAAASAGGILGAEARYGVSLAMPHQDQQFPWSTVVINSTGCLLIGLLMTVLLGAPSPHRLARPFLGVGVLGGYTTYSTFAVEVQRLVLQHRPLVAVGYAVLTVLACAGAVWLSSTLTARALPAGWESERTTAVEHR